MHAHDAFGFVRICRSEHIDDFFMLAKKSFGPARLQERPELRDDALRPQAREQPRDRLMISDLDDHAVEVHVLRRIGNEVARRKQTL